MNKNEIKSKYMIIEGIVSVIVNILLFAFKYAVGIFRVRFQLLRTLGIL